MLKIYVENTHNHLITPGKHSSWPPKHLLHVLLVHLADHLADEPFERLIDCSISPLIVIQPSREFRFHVTAYSSFLTCSLIFLTRKSSDVCS